MTPTYTTLLRRTAAAFAAITGVALVSTAVAQVPAGAVRLQSSTGATSSTQCTYGAMSVAPNGSITVTCNEAISVNGGSTPPPPPPASPSCTTEPTSFQLSSAGGTLAGGASPSPALQVQRTGSCSGGYWIGYRVEGDACGSPAAGTIEYAKFPGGNNDPINVPVTMGTTGTSCRIMLGVSGPIAGTLTATYTRQVSAPPPGSPTPPAGCPAVPSNAQFETFGVKMTHNRWRGDPHGNRVIIAPMPSWGDSTVPSMISMNSPFVYTPASGTVRYSISKCPGEIKTDYADVCNQATDVTMWTSYWLPRAMGALSSKATANASGYCWAPEAEGPWYMNIRYEFNGNCGGGETSCGMMWQYY